MGPGDSKLCWLACRENTNLWPWGRDLGWEEVRMSEQPVEKAQTHAKEERDLSFALDPSMAQSCLWLGPASGGSEAAMDQAEGPHSMLTNPQSKASQAALHRRRQRDGACSVGSLVFSSVC